MGTGVGIEVGIAVGDNDGAEVGVALRIEEGQII